MSQSSRRSPLVPPSRALPPRPPSRRRPVSGFYDPAVDRSATYRLSRRSRFWPGTDELAGDEWSYWYGDIALPRELQEPRARAVCLGDEARLDTMLLRQMGLLEEERPAYTPLPPRRRGTRGGSVGPLADAVNATEQTINHVENARRIRASSLSRMHETKRCIQNSVTFRDPPVRNVRASAERRVDVDWGLSRPPRRLSPRPRTFTDMKSEYDTMLSRMGVTKDLTVKHGRRAFRL